MTIQHERLISIIEFAQQSARLSARSAATVTQHNSFSLFEHKAQGRPAVHFNETEQGADREIWLAVERLHETAPPDCQNGILRSWITVGTGPDIEPTLRTGVQEILLLEAERLASRTTEHFSQPTPHPSTRLLQLDDYSLRAEVQDAFRAYLDSAWVPWSKEEKKRRETIRLYAQLFTLKQQLDGGLLEAPIELVWGVGIATWQSDGTLIQYPLLTQPVELLLNEITSTIEVTPRQGEPRLETDCYASADNPGLPTLEKKHKEFFASASASFSPFDRGSFEPLLRMAVTYLDPNGEYWADQVAAEDRTLPEAAAKLRITDTWVLFARPRMNNVFIQDLENFKTKFLDTKNELRLPRAVSQVVSEPSTENPEIFLPQFRGLSAPSSSGQREESGKASDLYFPKPFNDEQVRILQLLEVSDGVVVQGPPGTGKTHTIANVICHYLASGKKVLVTSMNAPALGVLREALPIDIQPLAISLLTSEHEGMKQFEHAIQKIASEVQSLDRQATARDICRLEETLDILHAKLANVGHEVERWARANLEPMFMDGERIGAYEAAIEIVEAQENYTWLVDSLTIDDRCSPKFGQEDILRLREARRALGGDIEYVNRPVPEMCDFPAPEVLLQAHRDLSRLEMLEAEVRRGAVLELAEDGDGNLAQATALLSDIREFRLISTEVAEANVSWSGALKQQFSRGDANDGTLRVLEQLGTELSSAALRREAYLSKPVSAPPAVIEQDELFGAITNLSEGKRPFPAFGWFATSEQKDLINSVSIVGHSPESNDDWKHVLEFLHLQKSLQQLAIRWNAIAGELNLDRVHGHEPDDGLNAAKLYKLVEKVKECATRDGRLRESARRVVPRSQVALSSEVIGTALEELERSLQQHLTKKRLAHVWAVKQGLFQRLEGKNGAIANRLRDFTTHTFGNLAISQNDLQSTWSDLMLELRRIHGLRSHLAVVAEVTEQIALCGAPIWAEALQHPVGSQLDHLLPDDWHTAWRHRRMATRLAEIDQQERLNELSDQRKTLEAQLAEAYKDIVVKRTWLKLAEHASPKIRAALQAYLNSIQKIGKGTGIRAPRYRADAKHAAAEANPAVPCWIMPHFRVSESIPCELGCFDLVIIDEASQSDLTALPALLRAEKVLIVGDDKQVSPEGIGLEEKKVKSLMERFLGSQVMTVRAQLSPERSIYDLFKVVFASSTVMLKEHFRCVAPIIEYSKREFYHHELRPLRRPKLSERLDPCLIDVIVEDGFRRGDINRPEARFIVEEIKVLVDDPSFKDRSIGVVSLLGGKQAREIRQMLMDEVGLSAIERHRIVCGDARGFQGKERSIMFLSMVCAPNEGKISPLVRDTFAQRFNVAASRAQDRMYLVRSVGPEHLAEVDRLRRGLIAHFSSPFVQDEIRVEDLRRLCESPFECEVYDRLTERGYCVTPQVPVGQFRIDMVVEGLNDARLAIECDGDRYHGPDKWTEDAQRQRILERAGWVFWRCFASAWVRRRDELLKDLLATLGRLGIEPCSAESRPRSIHTEQRTISISDRESSA